MSTRLDLGRILFLILLFTLSCMTLMAGNIKGNICDKETREPLTGATVQVAGTSLGAVADIDGNYQLNLRPGNYTLQVSYVGYRTETRDVAVTQANLVLNFELGPDTEVIPPIEMLRELLLSSAVEKMPCAWRVEADNSPPTRLRV